ncbi:hypothetical protein KQI52_09235 [bacterium]|nr:hypothetical protein [bacterium]
MILNPSNLKATPPINRRLFGGFAGAGALILAVGLIIDPSSAWANLLIVGFGLVTTGLAGLTFVAIHYLTGARWTVVIRRVPEAMSVALIPGSFLILITVLFAPDLYSWMDGLGDHAAKFKSWWLSKPFFSVRTVIYIAVWMTFGFAIVRASRKQDLDGETSLTNRLTRLSAGFIVSFGLTFVLATFDWLMSLEPHWFSTIYGVYHFAGLFESGLAIIILVIVWLQTRGPLRKLVNEEHLHDLGKLLFAFSTFWMYIWFSQYMLIWYSNIPEEAVYYTRRLEGAWAPLVIANIALNWAIPFLVLLPALTKRTGHVLAKVAGVVLLGRALDLYLTVMPAKTASPSFGFWEIGTMLLLVGGVALCIDYGLRGAAVLPIRDPFLEDSLNHQQ